MLALLQFIYFSVEVGRARGRFNVPVPATSGNELFERYFRAQQNTAEQLLVFLPAVYACSYFVSEGLATLMGLLFVLGRMLYFRGYTDPDKNRTLGFALGLLANVVMILATLYSLGMSLVS
jgi:uncharacterized membrane protein YecN with MAPEG domain